MTTVRGTPKLSVVIAASNSRGLLQTCLSSLRGQTGRGDTEIIVVSNYLSRAESITTGKFPCNRCICLPATTTVPELRMYGISVSQGEIVALLEDHGRVDEKWCEEIKKAHALPYAVIGGAVEPDYPLRPLDWAVYFYEYGKYMLPIDAGVTDSLPGNNVSYKKKVLKELQVQYPDGFFETFINASLRQRGEQLYLTPLVIVYHSRRYELGQVWSQCFHHGRHFAGRRVVGASLINRFGRLLTSFLLPFVLSLRLLRSTYRKKRHVRELWYSLPHLFACLSIWAFGEFCGYLCGEGESGKKWI